MVKFKLLGIIKQIQEQNLKHNLKRLEKMLHMSAHCSQPLQKHFQIRTNNSSILFSPKSDIFFLFILEQDLGGGQEQVQHDFRQVTAKQQTTAGKINFLLKKCFPPTLD